MGVCLGGVLDLVEGAFWLQESKRPRVMRGHEKMMSGHEAAKREEDGDKSVEAAGETFAGIKCFSTKICGKLLSTVFLKHSLP